MTTTTRRRTHWALAGLGTLTLALTATACDPSNGEPTPTPTETETTTEEPTTDEPTTEDPTLSERDQNIEDARQRYIEYNEVWTEVGQDGFENFEAELLPYLSGPARQTEIENNTAYRENRIHVEGGQEVVSVEAVEYTEDPTDAGHDRVHFEICLDNANFDMVDENGDSDIVDQKPTSQVEAIMQRSEGEWYLHDLPATEGNEC